MTLFELVASLTFSTEEFISGVKSAENEGESLAKKLGADAESIKGAFSDAFSVSIGQLMAEGFKTALGAAWDFTTGSVEAASSLKEIQNVVDTVFGDKAGAFDRWAENALDNFGMGEMAAKSYASTIASVLSPKTRGFNADEVYEMSTALTQLIGDIASFRNMDFDTVFAMIMSGLRGETESIEQLGIDMRATSLAAFAGVEESDWGYLSDYEQTMYRYQYIMSATTRMQGDFQRTQESYANQKRTFEENIAALQATLGEQLLPTMTSLYTIMNKLFAGEQSAADGIEAVKDAYGDDMATVATTATNALALVNALEELSAASEDAASTETWNAILQELDKTLPGIGDLIEKETGKIEGGTEALKAYIEQWKELELETSKQKAVEGLYDEYANIAYELSTLKNEQSVADILETENLRNMQEYERYAASIIEAGMKAQGWSPEQIETIKSKSWNFGLSSFWDTGEAEGWTAEEILRRYSYQRDPFDTRRTSLYDLWLAGGGTVEQFEKYGAGWGTFSEQYEKYHQVDNAQQIAELEGLLATQEIEIQTLMSLYNEMFKPLLENGTQADGTDDENLAAILGTLATKIDGLGGTLASSLSGITVQLDGTTVGQLITPVVSSELARVSKSFIYSGFQR